jgi:hypothetical protein
VDATILEVGVGGTYDSTNIVPKPIVTGITSLGLDHTNVLGKTLKEIAWQKGGIFKVVIFSKIIHSHCIDPGKPDRKESLLLLSLSLMNQWRCSGVELLSFGYADFSAKYYRSRTGTGLLRPQYSL